MNEVQAELERFHRDNLYYAEHKEELTRQYPDQWVAIFEEEVVGVGPDLTLLLTDLKSRGIPLGKIALEYLTTQEVIWILPYVEASL